MVLVEQTGELMVIRVSCSECPEPDADFLLSFSVRAIGCRHTLDFSSIFGIYRLSVLLTIAFRVESIREPVEVAAKEEEKVVTPGEDKKAEGENHVDAVVTEDGEKKEEEEEDNVS